MTLLWLKVNMGRNAEGIDLARTNIVMKISKSALFIFDCTKKVFVRFLEWESLSDCAFS